MLKKILTAALAAVTLATGAAQAGAGIESLSTKRVASGLAFPVYVTHAPGDFTRLYIVQKAGRIRILNLKTGVINATDFMNIDSLVGGGTSTNDERGLLGLCFHPDWVNNRYFYVNYINNSGNTVVARYTANDGDTANTATATTILSITQPFTNHNGGWIEFGPDGYLYIATGDGGNAGDPGNRAQTIVNQKLGKILRIDVNNGTPYSSPPSNPFVGITGDDEIWAYGLRNPWRNSFDRETGDLYIGDVGQDAWEEVNFQPASHTGGRNYGWRCREGAHNFNFAGSCSTQTFTEPFYEYSHSTGLCITGGYVYRGCNIPSLRGTYFLADYSVTRVVTFNAGGGTTNLAVRTAELAPDVGALGTLASFGQDARGELYLVDQGGGTSGEIFRVVGDVTPVKPADFDCDGLVAFGDLLSLLAAYGPCDGCLEDIDGDHDVDFNDVLELLAAWD